MVPALSNAGARHRFILYHREDADWLENPLPPNVQARPVAFGRPRLPRRLLWEQLVLPRRLASDGVHLLVAPADVAPIFSRCPVVLAIRNANPWWGPASSTLLGRLRERMLRRLSTLSARRAARVWFVSEDSMRRIGGRLGIPSERMRVIPHGCPPWIARAASLPAPALVGNRPPHILSVGAVRVHKDYEAMIEAFGRFVRHGGAPDGIRLLIAGHLQEPSYQRRLEGAVARAGVSDRVNLLGGVPVSELAGLYHSAFCVVVASRVETFGYPLLEAMAFGKPVVATDIGPLRELGGDAALWYPEGDGPRLAAQLEALAASPSRRLELSRRARERAADYTVEKAAGRILALIEECAYDSMRRSDPPRT